jgi:glycine/D-amino acid oxidase-like deaminating enzyme
MAEGHYDVIIVGGGPIGLSSAYECVAKRGKRVLLLEQFDIGNQHGSSAGLTRQWRTVYSDRNLCGLALKTSPLWDILMEELGDNEILHRSGVLWFGTPEGNESEGNIPEAVKNLEYYEVDPNTYEQLNKVEIFKKFPFIANAIMDLKDPTGLFSQDAGTIYVKKLISGYQKAFKDKYSQKYNSMDNMKVVGIDYNQPDKIVVTCQDPGPLPISHPFSAERVILTPGTYINHILSSINPKFDKIIDLEIHLWCSTYFRCPSHGPAVKQTGDPQEWPTWYFFGKPKEPVDGAIDFQSYYGFPSMSFEGCGNDQFARVAPAYTSKTEFDFDNYPPSIENRPVDVDAMKFTARFVKKSMPTVDPTLLPEFESTCIAGFAQKQNGEDDPGSGFVLDFLPGSQGRIVLTSGGWAMKFVPMFGKILADLAITGSTEYEDLIVDMKIDRGVLIDPPVKGKPKGKALSTSQRAAMFNKLCC